MTALIYGFIQVGAEGRGDGAALLGFVAAVVLLAAFVAIGSARSSRSCRYACSNVA